MDLSGENPMNEFTMNVKAAKDGGGFTAVASTTDVDTDGEIIDFRAFDPLPAWIPIHHGHDFAKQVGSGKPYYANQRLYVDGTFARTTLGQEVRTMVLDGHLPHMSVVFRNPQRRNDA